jgi:hypothetical protein
MPNLQGSFNSDSVLVLCDTSAGSFTVTMPAAQLPQVKTVTLKNDGANLVTVNFPIVSRLKTYNDLLQSVEITAGNSLTFLNDRLSGNWVIDGNDTSERSICIAVVESDSAVAIGGGLIGFTIPAVMNGWGLIAALASVHTKGVTGTTDVQIRRRRAGVDANMLSTLITIGDEFFASDGIVYEANSDISTGDQIYVDVDAVHSGTAPNGLSVTLTFEAA